MDVSGDSHGVPIPAPAAQPDSSRQRLPDSSRKRLSDDDQVYLSL